MINRYFLYSVHDQTFTEVDLDQERELTDDRAFVHVTVHPTGCNLTAGDYAGPGGSFELTVSQPLPVALAIFRAALVAADDHADGVLALPVCVA